MTDRAAARLAWGTFVFAALLFVGGFWFFLLNRSTSYGEVAPSDSAASVVFLVFALVGAPVAARRPRNPIGWILLAIGVGWGSYAFLIGYALYGVATDPGSIPGPDVALAVVGSGWIVGVGLMGTFLLLLFPTGRLPSLRWRPFARITAIVIALGFLVGLVLPVDFENLGFPDVENPLGLEPLRPVVDVLSGVIVLGVLLCIAGSVVSLIRRFRRSVGRERLQMKWLATGATATAACYVVMMLVAMFRALSGSGSPATWTKALEVVAVQAFLLIPIAIGIAILKHRLYDIDRLINRTLVYGALTLTLGLAYAVVVTMLQRVSAPLTQDSALAVAGSTLVVASLLGPARRRIQRLIDRLFYRSRFDATRIVEDFSTRLRDEVNLEALTENLLGVVDKTMNPSHVSLWLRDEGEVQPT